MFITDTAGPRPDPASRSQPNGCSRSVGSDFSFQEFAWNDREWMNLPLADYIIYELHTGTFTPEGSFMVCIERLDNLQIWALPPSN